MSAPDNILERIRKLLRMKRGGFPSEIETALALAAELARIHGIDLASVNPDVEQRRPITHKSVMESSRIQWECKYAAMICHRFFNVNALVDASYRSHRIQFIGTVSDMEIAEFVYAFLVGHMRWTWRHKRGRARNRQAFLYGMYQGIFVTLRRAQQASDPGDAAMVFIGQELTRRQNYIREQFGDTQQTDTKPGGAAKAAEWSGYQSGRATRIPGGLKAGEGGRKELIA